MPGTFIKRAKVTTALALITIFLFLILFSSAVSAAMLGDINSDGFINIQDVVLIQKHILGLDPPLTEAQKVLADVNRDGIVDVLDATLITQMALGLISEFPLLPAPAQLLPANNAVISGPAISFSWNPSRGANKYQLEVIRVSDGAVYKDQLLGNHTFSAETGFLNDGAQYRWRVRGGHDTGWGSWSGYRYFTNGTIPTLSVLTAPVLVSPVNNVTVSTSSVFFEWQASSEANRYKLEIRNNNTNVLFRTVVLGDVSASIQYGFPNDGTQYKWRVQAGNDAGWIDTAWSEYQIYTNGVPVSPILSATTLTLPADNATAAGTSITFQWAAVSGANKYELEVTRASDNAVYKNQVLENITSSTQVGFLNDGIRYRWRLRAGNDAGWGYWSVYRTFTNGLPAAPVLLLPAANANEASSSITFEWKLSSGANRYKLELRNNATNALVRTVELGNASATILDGFPSDGTQYKWRVQAGNEAGWIETAWSDYRILNNGILPAPPVLVSPENNGNIAGSSIFFWWSPSTGATKYEIKVSKGVNVFKTQALGYSTSVILDDFPNDGTEYEWCVRAGNISGWGNWSNCRTLTNGAKIAAPVLVSPADNTNTKSTSVMFEWKLTNGADKYQLRLINSDDTVFRTVSLGNTTASIQHDLLNNAHYRWQVRGGNDVSDYEWGEWSGTRNLIVGNLLYAPTLISPAEAVYKDTTTVLATDTKIEFKWAASSGANKYEFEIIRVRDGAVFGSNDSVTGTTYEQAGFTNDGAEYKWRVRAGKNIGKEAPYITGWGAWSGYRHFVNEAPLSTAATPALYSPAFDSLAQGTSIEFSWATSTGANNYQLQVVRVSDGVVVVDGPLGNVTISTQAGFPNDGTEFMWRVRASDATGWGAWSYYRIFTNGFWWLNLF